MSDPFLKSFDARITFNHFFYFLLNVASKEVKFHIYEIGKRNQSGTLPNFPVSYWEEI